MSRLGDIYNSYGAKFSVALANTYSYNVANAALLPKNTIILASPYDVSINEDLGNVSMFVTDNDGTPVRLTYSISQENGLYVENDTIKMHLGDFLKENENNEISLDVENLIDNDTLVLDNGIIECKSKTLRTASRTQTGVFKIDNSTIKLSNNNQIYVDTQSLDLANNGSNSPGILYSDSDEISISNGVVSITDDLRKCDSSTYGVCKTDGISIKSYSGVLSASIDGFNEASNNDFGICNADNRTTYIDNDNVIHANFDSLNDVLVKPDGTTLDVNNGVLYVKVQNSINNSLLLMSSKISDLDLKISNLEERLRNATPVVRTQSIFGFTCKNIASSVLVKPREYGELTKDMQTQKVSAEFVVKTNCPFKINIESIDNIAPQVLLYEINYDDLYVMPGNSGLSTTFKSTDNQEKKLVFSWLCKNYRSNTFSEYSTTTKFIITVASADDASQKKHLKYSIVRYNSLFNDKIDYEAQNDEIIIDKYKKKKKEKPDYGIDIRQKNTNWFSYENPYYTALDSSELWPSYIDNGTFVQANTLAKYGLTNINFAYVAKINEQTNNVVEHFLNNSQSLNITCYALVDNEYIPTRDVDVKLEQNTITLAYTGEFYKINND